MPIKNAFKSSRFIKTEKNILSRSFDDHRVDVLLPKQLHSKTPILVIHDGMNVLFKKYASSGDTWQVRESIDSGRIIGDPLVVAVWGEGGIKKYNSRRINEFLCDDIFAAQPELWATLNPLLEPETHEPRGNYFVNLIADQILPAVTSEFNIELDARRTAIAGCSVAGVASIYSVAKRPDVFGAAIGLSSHWEFGGKHLIDALAAMLAPHSGKIIWSDSGTEGLDEKSEPLNNYFGEQLGRLGFVAGANLETPTFWGTGHHETFWARRFEYPVNMWLKNLDAPST
jgi:predicted alpha/beta superfamily hydrolase